MVCLVLVLITEELALEFGLLFGGHFPHQSPILPHFSASKLDALSPRCADAAKVRLKSKFILRRYKNTPFISIGAKEMKRHIKQKEIIQE